MKRNLYCLPMVLLLVGAGTFLLSQSRARDGDSRKFRLSPVVQVTSSKNPTMDAGRISPKFQGWGHLWGEVEFWEIAN